MVGVCGQGEEIKSKNGKNTLGSIEDVRNKAERELILETLKIYGNNKTKAAKSLNIARPLLYQKMKRLGIVP
jgi:transcriptional regulator with PAS, ATPase and Fis domain